MSASAVFAAELDALGIWWPQGDGDALRVAADGWTAAADLIEDIAAVLDVAAGMVVEHHHGEAAARFGELWSAWSGPQGYLEATVADCRRIATALVDFATDVDVADRAIVRLVEDALAARAHLALLDEIWRAWLADGASGIADELSARADAAAGALAGVHPAPPVRSADDRAVLDPAQVTWPDLGTPADLGHLATSPVDLGAGEGDPDLLPVVPLDPDGPTDPVSPVDPIGGPEPLPSSGWPSGGGVTIVVQGDGNTITVEQPAAPSWTPSSFDPDPVPPVDPLEWVPSVPDAAYEPAVGVGSSWDPPLPSVAGPVASAPARLAEIDTVDAPGAEPEETPVPTPVLVDPPGRSAAIGIAGAATAATAAAARSGRAPFMPFMPMAGGMAGGDESPEPKRRVARRRPQVG